MPTIRSSFAGFTTAQLGMSASQAAMNVAGQNISNVNTKGYTRQRVDLDSFNVSTGPTQWGGVNQTFIGNGVLTNRIEQVRDPYLDLRFRTEMAGVGYYDKTLAGLEDLQSTLDEVDKEGSIHNQLEAIFKALNEFNPQAANNEFQNMAKTELQLLTQYFNSYSNAIKQTKEDNMTEFKDQTIPAVNQLLVDITNLNKSIRENEILGNPALELRDERNLLLDELSKYVKIEVTYEDKYVGLSSKIAQECTVKMIGTDEKGNFFKYTIIDHDKASQFQIDDDCSTLTMTDVNGNPIADIGSALKPADGVTKGNFTKTQADEINELLEKIQQASKDMDTLMKEMHTYNQQINSLGSSINNLSRRGTELLKDLKNTLRSQKSVAATRDKYQEQLDELRAVDTSNYTEQQKAQYDKNVKDLEDKIADRERVLKIYNEQLYGTENPQDPVNATYINGLPTEATANNTGAGLYNKLKYIYGNIEADSDLESPTYAIDPDTNDFEEGALAQRREELAKAQQDLAKTKADYTDAETTLRQSVDGVKDKDGNVITKGLKDYANIVADYETYPVDGTNFFISLPTITLGGTSARDGNGIPLFDPDVVETVNEDGKVSINRMGKIGKIDVTGDTITITDTREVEYTEKVANVDGTPYTKDADGKTVLDMDDQRNMYDYMQEDNGSIKAALDLFNRAGEFNGSTDRGYDYYLNMLDVFARQIAKVFNEANTKNLDGSPLLDSNGKPLDYANALFGADGEIPIKNVNVTDADGQYLGLDGTFSDKPIPDVFKTDTDGYLLDDNGQKIEFPTGSGEYLTLNVSYQEDKDNAGNLLDKNGNPITDNAGNAVTTTDFTNALKQAALDETALAAYGIVRSKEEVKNTDGTLKIALGDWVDKDGNKIADADDDITTGTDKTDILDAITAGKYEPLAGKVPKIDYEQITASNFSITKDWADAKTHFVQTHDPSQTAGYNDNINHLISVFGQKLDYTFTQEDGTQKTIFNGTFVEFYDNMGNQLGLDIKSSTILANNAISITNDLANNRDAVSGVSLDEEGIDILRYQKAFTASARVMTALDEILDKVINGMGVVGR